MRQPSPPRPHRIDRLLRASDPARSKGLTHEAIERALEGPGEAIVEALYRATRTDVLADLIRRAANAEEAADMLAETYLIACRKVETIPPGDRARLWLFGVTRNVSLTGVRRRRVADALVERLAGEVRAAGADTATDDPGYHVLDAALAELSERDREVVTLTAWEGLTPREIAAVLDMSANAVRIRLHRARRRLTKALEAQQCVARSRRAADAGA